MKSAPPMRTPKLPVIGWREWVALPDLGIVAVKAKIDTGARTSSIHAFDIREEKQGRRRIVRFVLHPLQKNVRKTVHASAEVLDRREVRSSSGHVSVRYAIETTLVIGPYDLPIELTLTNRDEMGFRMLLGRQALRREFLIDPGRSYYFGRRQKTS